jgi:hypothetical protein
MHNGDHGAPSNAAFDKSLKARNPAWHLGNMADVGSVTEAAGFRRDEAMNLPASNK